MTQFKAVVFDLGKVVFDLSFDNVFSAWSSSSGLSFEETKRNFKFDELFNQFERNEIDEIFFRAEISKRNNLNLSDIEFDNAWCSLYLEPYEGINEILIQIKKNYKLVALTNTNIIHDKVWRIKYAQQLIHFEKIFASHLIGTRKPESESYLKVLDYLNCKPHQSLFLDDNVDNVTAARSLGMAAIVVKSPGEMIDELQRIGIILLRK